MAENLALLSPAEKSAVYHHLGYPFIDPVGSIQLGVPGVAQPQFLVASALERIPQSAVGRIRTTIATLDGLESQIREAALRTAAREAGGVVMNPDELKALSDHYERWARELAADLGVPLYESSAKFSGGGGGGRRSLNVRVFQS